jgi:hypothetical protein
VTLLFALTLAAMIIRSANLLRLARWVCYAGLVASAAALLIGIIGFFMYSVDMALYLLVGIVWGYMFAVNLAGIKEAKHRVGHRDDSVRET